MRHFFQKIFIAVLTFSAVNTTAALITWDFEVEVSFVENTSMGAWLDPVVAGDVLNATLSFDDNLPVLSDDSRQTVFDASNIVFDIASLTTDSWLNNLSPVSWANHSSRRESITVQNAYSVDNTVLGETNWEALIFGFQDSNASEPFTSFPTDWAVNPLSFTYHRDLDINQNISEVYITGQAISAVQRVPEPATMTLLLLALLMLSKRKHIMPLASALKVKA